MNIGFRFLDNSFKNSKSSYTILILFKGFKVGLIHKYKDSVKRVV